MVAVQQAPRAPDPVPTELLGSADTTCSTKDCYSEKSGSWHFDLVRQSEIAFGLLSHWEKSGRSRSDDDGRTKQKPRRQAKQT